jgi:general secretion pathway protein F
LTLVISMLAKNFIAVTSVEYLRTPPFFLAAIWIPPLIVGLLLVAGLVVVGVPQWRAKIRWWLPAFREASLAQLASTMALVLKSGTPLPEALALAAMVESNSPAGNALTHWRSVVESGRGKPAQWLQPLYPFPPMFLWLVQKGGEDLATGFQKAADIYQSRASYKTDLLLYGALPISILLLGQMIIWQVTPVFRTLIWMMNMLGS